MFHRVSPAMPGLCGPENGKTVKYMKTRARAREAAVATAAKPPDAVLLVSAFPTQAKPWSKQGRDPAWVRSLDAGAAHHAAVRQPGRGPSDRG